MCVLGIKSRYSARTKALNNRVISPVLSLYFKGKIVEEAGINENSGGLLFFFGVFNYIFLYY